MILKVEFLRIMALIQTMDGADTTGFVDEDRKVRFYSVSFKIPAKARHRVLALAVGKMRREEEACSD